MTLTQNQIIRRQVLSGIGVGLCCSALLSGFWLGGLFEAFDERLLDWRFRLRGVRDASSQVAVVAVDDPTIRAYGGWPLPRDQYALLLTALEECGVRAVGVDLQLPEDVNHDPKSNALLAYVSKHETNIVHAISFVSDEPSSSGRPESEAHEAFRRQGEPCEAARLPVAAKALLPYDELVDQARALGHITVMTDRDGSVRRVPLLVCFQARAYPALGLRMVGVGSGHEGPPRVTGTGRTIRVGWGPPSEWSIPLDREGSTAVDFAGGRSAFSSTYSMIDLLRAYQAGDVASWRERLAGKYVLVGLDSRTEVTDDVGATPFSSTTSLVFIHANVVDNLLRHRFLARAGAVTYVAALVMAGMALGWLFSVLPLPLAAVAAGSALGGAGILSFAALAYRSLDIPPVAALLLPALTYAGISSTRLFVLSAQTRRRESDLREGRSVEQQFLPEALIGKSLSRYRIEEKLGRGGIGVVYRARDSRLDRDVAVKVLSGRAFSDEQARKRFRREALTLSKVNHPHVAGVLDFDTQDGTDFLVMEFVRGTSLGARIRRGALPESEVIRVAEGVSRALAEIHGRNIVHRDLKPDNIMLGESGEVKVLDFGLARLQQTRIDSNGTTTALTEAGHLVGTLPYMSPEVIRGSGADSRSDLYSLGVILFEMATGKRPFPDDEPHELLYTILNQPPPRPRIINGRIPARLEEIILKLLAKNPDERFGSASELLQALADCGSGTGDLFVPGAGKQEEGRDARV